MKIKDFNDNLPPGFKIPTDDIGKKMLREYGAVYVARGGAIVPGTVIFKDKAEVSSWQAKIPVTKKTVAGIKIELQTPAMNALSEALEEAKQNNLRITPRGTDAARRSYGETETLWASRVNPGLEHWVGKRKLSRKEAARIRSLSPFEQVPEIFRLEAKGIFFSTNFSKSIIYSVAPPGASQHLSMLALDVSEYGDPKVRSILARHGWFQTVVSDLPHFTYLGVTEKKLPELGLKKVSDGGRSFWVPD
jgi:hypothetical protein